MRRRTASWSVRMWLWSWTYTTAASYVSGMNANAKIAARHRAREAQARANEKRYRRDRANADDAATIRTMLHRVGAVEVWECKRLDQAAEFVRADAVKRRAGYFADIQAAVDRMRERDQTLAAIATLVELDVREIRSALRSGRTGDTRGLGLVGKPGAGSRPPCSDAPEVTPGDQARSVDSVDGGTDSGATRSGSHDSTRCVRCDAVMLDADDAPRRGRRRLYCSDTCRRDASSARKAAERYGSPVRVVEVPRAGSCVERDAYMAGLQAPLAVTPLDAADITLRDVVALQALLARVTEQARLKKLDRATLTAARELAKAVHPHRNW